MVNAISNDKNVAVNKADRKKYVRYDVACEIYGMGLTKLKEVARDAGAVRKMNRMVLINTAIMDEYIETFQKG